MKGLKWIIMIALSLIVISLLLFALGCLGGHYNQEVLDELKGRIIYTKRDDDGILKIYTAYANLENEKLLYEHHDSIDNGNIIRIQYDETNDSLLFEAYDDNLEDWGLFQLDSDLNVTPLGLLATDVEKEWSSTTSNSEYEVISENGDLYLSNLSTNQQTLLKNFHGIFDIKFSPGYSPLAISKDGTFVFFSYSKHATPFGLLFEAMINPNYQFQTYVLNVKTGQESLYVNFEDIIFIP